MKLKWRVGCDNEVKFKFEHESKLRIEIEFEDKNYKTGYDTLLKFGVQEVDVISTNFPRETLTSNRWWIDEDVSIGR